jgi:hypothetical protein
MFVGQGTRSTMKTLAIALLLLSLPAHAEDWKFWTLNVAHTGAAIADVEITQHCLANGTCREGNPLMPSNRAGAYGMAAGFVVVEGIAAHRIRNTGSNKWWIYPVMGISAHGVGIGLTVTR